MDRGAQQATAHGSQRIRHNCWREGQALQGVLRLDHLWVHCGLLYFQDMLKNTP